MLDALGSAWLRVGDRARARQAWLDQLAVQPRNRRVLARLCELAIEAGNHAEARRLVTQLKTVEGANGAQARYAEVEILIDQARRGDARALDQVPRLISEIALSRGDWWGISVLKAQVAEALDRLDDAIGHCRRSRAEPFVQSERSHSE